MKRAISIFLSIAIIFAMCPAITTFAEDGSPKIDLSSYVSDLKSLGGSTSASNYSQPVVTASASYEMYGFGVANLIDGIDNNASYRFIGIAAKDLESEYVTTWIQLDLQKIYTVDALSFNSSAGSSGAGLPKDFTIEVSEDGDKWTTVYTKTGQSAVAGTLYTYNFTATDARYVKLNVTAIVRTSDANLGNCLSLRELSVYGVEKVEEKPESVEIDLTGYVSGMTSASNFVQTVVTASASYEQYGVGVAALIDGDTSTRFAGIAAKDLEAAFVETWIQLDLQKFYTVDMLAFTTYAMASSQGLPKDFTIEVSVDGNQWTTVYTKTGLAAVAGTNQFSFEFEPTDARYVKLNVTAIGRACDLGNCVSLKELDVYGVEKEVSAVVDGIAYGNIQDAVSAAIDSGTVLNLVEDATDAIVTVDAGETLKLDLNGKTLGKLIANGTVNVMDTATKVYTNTEYGKITTVEGTVDKIYRVDDGTKGHVYNGYAMLNNGEGYSFHYFEVKIASVTLRPTEAGIGYKLHLAGNAQVKAMLDTDDAFGVSVYKKDSTNKPSAHAGSGAFEVGEQTKLVMIENILTEGNVTGNATNIDVRLCVDAYININGEQVTVTYDSGKTMREVIAGVDASLGSNPDNFTQVQKDALKTMYTKYELSDAAYGLSLTNIAALISNSSAE